MNKLEKIEFVNKRLKELNAPCYFYDASYVYRDNSFYEKAYNILKNNNATLDILYSELGIVNYEGYKDISSYNKEGLFLKSISLNRDRYINFNKYPYCIKVIKDLYTLSFGKKVTFLVGSNGVGKSTLIEALAIKLGLNAEGGTQNFNFCTKDTHSTLYQNIVINKNVVRPKTMFFFRAETFYNFATEVENLEVEGYGNTSLHNCSHGEAFMALIENRFTDKGLYILDEPEAALSPFNQMKLLYIIDSLVKKGSQFIIATHSPIIMSYRDADIFDLDNNYKRINYKETETYNLYKRFIDDSESIQRYLFDVDD